MQRTAEFVSPLHPDKICDRISDNILDRYLQKDSESRVAVEVMGGREAVTVVGEVTSDVNVDVVEAVEEVCGRDVRVEQDIVSQSQDIARGVDSGGAGDQGIMTGYACSETKTLMPLEYELARTLAKKMFEFYQADGKTQVTVDEKGLITRVVCSWADLETEKIKEQVDEWLRNLRTDKPKIFINPAGDWNTSGFDADTGLTGRKIVVDNYGPRVPVGGGAFSGKDPSKVDRSGAYMARKIATDILEEKDANKVQVKLAYGIGVREPVMATMNVDGDRKTLPKNYQLDYQSIINQLNLKKPRYHKLAKWGHFGHKNEWD